MAWMSPERLPGPVIECNVLSATEVDCWGARTEIEESVAADAAGLPEPLALLQADHFVDAEDERLYGGERTGGADRQGTT